MAGGETSWTGWPNAVARRTGPWVSVVVAAGLFALACPPYDWAWAAWAVPGLLLVPTRHLRAPVAFASGVLYAVVIGALITSWAPHAALIYFDANPLLARAFITAVHLVNPGLACGLLVCVYAGLHRRVAPAVRPLMGAWMWVASELLRVWSLGWEILGHSQYEHLPVIQIADLGGVYAVSFVMAAVSIGVAEVLADGRAAPVGRRAVVRRLALPCACLVASLAYGVDRGHAYAHVTDSPARTVAVVQGNIPNAYRWKRAFFARNIATYAELTRGVDAPVDLIVWPENAVSFYVNQDALLRAQLAEVAAGAPQGLILGAPRRDAAQQAYNSVYLLDGQGRIGGIYDKQKLVPFAEYNPLRALSGATTEGDVYVPGATATPLRTPMANIGAMVCYEVLFPGLVRALVRDGAELLVNVSNDSWMDSGDGAAPRQHLSMAVFRAVETRRFLVRAASSGLSAFVRPDGAITAVLANGTASTAVASVVARREHTVYVRWGDRVWGLVGLALVPTVVRGRPARVA